MDISVWHLFGVAVPYFLIATALWGLISGAVKDAVHVDLAPARVRLGRLGVPTVPLAYAMGFLAVAFIYGCSLDRHHMGAVIGTDPHAIAPGADDFLYGLAGFSWLSCLLLVVPYPLLRRGTRHLLSMSSEHHRVEDRYRLLAENMADSVCLHEPDGGYKWVSPSSQAIFGYAPEELVGRSPFEIIHPDDIERVRQEGLQRLKSGAAKRTLSEYRIRHKEGHYIWFETVTEVIRDENGWGLRIVTSSRDVTERQEARMALVDAAASAEARERTIEEQHHLLHTVLDAIPDTIFVKDLDGRVILQNAHTGDEADDMLGKTVFDLFPEEEAEVHHRAEQEVMRTGKRLDEEHHYVMESGKEQARLTTKVPLRGANAEVIGIVAVSRDVTEQKAVEEALRSAKEAAEIREREAAEHRHMLQTIVDTIPDFVYAMDRKGQFTLRNQASVVSHGLTTEKAFGKTEFDLFPEELAAQYWRDNQRVMESGEPLVDRVEPDQNGGFVLTTKIPLRDAKGEVAGLVGISRDITEQKAVEKALREAKEAAETRENEVEEQRRILQTVIDTIPDHIYLKDAQGRATLRNRASAQALGFENPGDSIGRTDAEILPGFGAAILADDLRVIQTGEPLRNHEEPDAEGGWLLTTKVPLLTTSGEIVGLVGVSRDITAAKAAEMELRAAKDEAEAATRAKSEFLANMSHEIRTPMNGVVGMTSLLLDTPLNNEQRDFVETIRTSGDALLTIINDILDFSKIEAGMMDLEEHPFDVRQCVEESLDLIAPRAAEKGIELAYLVEDGVPASVLGDVTRVRQVLVNLLSNAVKFTAEGSVCVRIEARPPDTPAGSRTTVWFSVDDTGIGIAEDKLRAVFEAFSQADASTTRQFGGTGLGLTISSRLVEMMGGEIGVESVLGEGSTFRFSIDAEVAPSERRVFLRPEQPVLEGRRTLVVDDNAVNREILTRLASRWRMAPEAVESGEEGLAAVERAEAEGRPYDLVLLDMQMPGMDGIEVARRLNERPNRPVVVMLTSIHRSISFRADAKAAGVHTVLYKPTKPSQLYDTLIGIFGSQTAETAWVARPRAGTAGGRARGDGPAASLRILLAEDNAVNQKVALRLLERIGYRADMVANGVEAVEAVRRQPYDLVLMDVQMPEMDGLEATRVIRAAGAEVHQPQIVALTANAMEGDRERCLDAGCDDYLTKPVVVESLREAIERSALTIAVAAR